MSGQIHHCLISTNTHTAQLPPNATSVKTPPPHPFYPTKVSGSAPVATLCLISALQPY